MPGRYCAGAYDAVTVCRAGPAETIYIILRLRLAGYVCVDFSRRSDREERPIYPGIAARVQQRGPAVRRQNLLDKLAQEPGEDLDPSELKFWLRKDAGVEARCSSACEFRSDGLPFIL